MEGGVLCKNCGEASVITDPNTSFLVCESCGLVHRSEIFHDEQSFDSSGLPLGTLHFAGNFGYHERKLYRARTLMSDISNRLCLTRAHAVAASRLALTATDGHLGSGDWFTVLAAACSVIVLRQDGSPLPLSEAAQSVGCTPHDLGRMIARVSRHLDLGQIPGLNVSRLLDRAASELPSFSSLDAGRSEEVLGQARFVLHCSIRWFLATGRHPLPLVAAVLSFVASANGLAVRIEEIARKIHARLRTARLRLKELMELLVKVAKKLLPWGDDVTVKNIALHAPVLIRLLELKSKSKSMLRGGSSPPDLEFIDLGEILDAYSDYADLFPEESKYFQLREGDGGGKTMDWDDVEKVKLSADKIRLSRDYESVPNANLVEGGGGRERRGLEIEEWVESWKGRWKYEKGLTLEQVLQRSEGFDALPPSFIKGMELRRKRREKIEAARRRIQLTTTALCSEKKLDGSRKRRRGLGDELDWEDCIIELLMLHRADEDEIEQGYYNRLMDLHVFTSLAL